MPSSPHGHARQRLGSHPADSRRPDNAGLSHRAPAPDGCDQGPTASLGGRRDSAARYSFGVTVAWDFHPNSTLAFADALQSPSAFGGFARANGLRPRIAHRFAL